MHCLELLSIATAELEAAKERARAKGLCSPRFTHNHLLCIATAELEAAKEHTLCMNRTCMPRLFQQ